MAVVMVPVNLAFGTGQELWEALRNDRRWARADTLGVSVDVDDPTRAQVRARFESLEAATAFREELGKDAMSYEVKSGFSARAAGRPELFVNPERLQREQRR